MNKDNDVKNFLNFLGAITPLDQDVLTYLPEQDAVARTSYLDEDEDGTYTYELPGVGQDDIDTIVTDDELTINIKSDYMEGQLILEMPENVTDVNISVSKGLLTLSFVYKPCDINVNFV